MNGAGAGAGAYGLDLQAGSSGSTIRGLCINRCSARAIRIQGSSNNVIAGNFLGTNLAGTAAGPGNSSGIFIGSGASATPTNNNRIGGTAAADRNIISGNTVDGVQIDGGTWRGLEQRRPGQLHRRGCDRHRGRGQHQPGRRGIQHLVGPNTNNVIGGTAPGAGNVISGNGGDGVRIRDAGTTGTLVQGNKIGTNAAGHGRHPQCRRRRPSRPGTSNNTVGGTAAGAGNLIAFNNSGNTFGLGGIYFDARRGTGNSILGNAIYSNGGLGIDLNEARRHCQRPQRRRRRAERPLNFPVISGGPIGGARVAVIVQLDVPAVGTTIEFFKNPSGTDPTNGEARSSRVHVNHRGPDFLPFFTGNLVDRHGQPQTA